MDSCDLIKGELKENYPSSCYGYPNECYICEVRKYVKKGGERVVH